MSGRTPEVRAARRGDGPDLAACWIAWGRSYAARNGSIIGFVEADLYPGAEHARFQIMREVAEPSLMVKALFVAEAERGHSIGHALMLAAEEWGRSRGATNAAVVAIEDSPDAVGFYTDRMGYRPNSIGLWKRLR